MTGTKRIHGVVSVRMEALDSMLFVRFDRRLTDAPRVTAAVQAVIDSVP